MNTFRVLACLGTLAYGACSSSSNDEAKKDGLPETFGDCDASTCEVKLSAFTANPGAVPYCPGQKAELDLTCASHPGLETASCGDLFVARVVYGFPGDYYQCVYQGDALVGAKWAPDNHPTQIAGTQPPDGCAPAAACADGGGDAAAD